LKADAKLAKLRGKIKIPLILMACGAGLLGSLSLTFLKGMTEAYAERGLFGGVSLYCYLILAIVLAVYQLLFLNKSMEIYD
jgi:hypothetical protein